MEMAQDATVDRWVVGGRSYEVRRAWFGRYAVWVWLPFRGWSWLKTVSDYDEAVDVLLHGDRPPAEPHPKCIIRDENENIVTDLLGLDLPIGQGGDG